MNRTRLLLYSALAAALVLGLWTWSGTDSSRDVNRKQALEGLGYLSGYERATGDTGVLLHEPGAWKGYNLYVSGDGPVARLIDMKGRVVHRWEIPWEKAFGDRRSELAISGPNDYRTLRKFHAFPNGDLIAIFEGLGTVKIDRQSEVQWSVLNHAHHDLWTRPDTYVYVLSYQPREMDLNDRNLFALDDAINVYSSSGELLRQFSIHRALKNSKYRGLLSLAPQRPDVFHTNSLEILPDTGLPEPWRGGDALVSIIHLNTIAVIDFGTEEVIWTMTGRGVGHHDAELLESGNLMFLDNGKHREQSTVRIVDPVTRKEVWSYTAPGFYSHCCGTNQRLPNGNTLITDTSQGRAFEVTPEGRLAWEFKNPYRSWNRIERVASIYAMKRYPTDFFEFLHQ